MTKKIALFPGSFDPITLGHLDIIQRGSQLFDEVVVGIFTNTHKKSLFTPQEKLTLVQEACQDLPNVKVLLQEQELTVATAQKIGASVLLRGVRSVKDFEYEQDIAAMNAALAPEVETVILFTAPKYRFIASSLLKEVFTFDGDVAPYLPPNVAQALKEKQEVPHA